jgi:glycosyltransferase involved in cell wall biosynthesis
MKMAARNFSRHQGNSLNGMVIPSQPMLDALREYGVTSHAEVIPTGLEPESFVLGDKAAFRQRYNIPLDQPMMLLVGRVAHEKNIGFLLNVVAQVRKTIPDVLLLIAGEGPARIGLEKEVATRQLSNSVKFIGYLDRRTLLNHCYASADVFVFSSRTETQGLVLLEAMAQGTAVVALAEMGTKDVLREGLGVRIAQNDSLDFSAKVIALLQDADARQKLGAHGREYAHTWSAHNLASRLVFFYESTISAYSLRQ